jgi:hypothetical protein
MNKPSVFVGSSTEGLEVARAIKVQLDDDADLELWNEGVFALGQGTLESMTQALSRFDFAILVLTPDDSITVRGTEHGSARDNVLIEVGLFIGRLGRERTFLVLCKDENFKIPSELAGITFAAFSKPNDDNLIRAVGSACVKIRNAIRAQGKAADLKRLAAAVENQGQKVDAQTLQLQQQQEMINQLVKYSMSASIFHHLCGIAVLREYKYHHDEAMQREMYFLRDNGFIKPKSSAFVDFSAGLDGANVADIAEPTPAGWACLRLRRGEIPTNMLGNPGNLRIDPRSLSEI